MADLPETDVQDPVGPPSDQMRVVKGGSWQNLLPGLRIAARGGFNPDGKREDLGFRVISGYFEISPPVTAFRRAGRCPTRLETTDKDERLGTQVMQLPVLFVGSLASSEKRGWQR